MNYLQTIFSQMMEARRLQSKVLFVIPPARKAGQNYIKKFIEVNKNMKPTYKIQFWCKPFGKDYYRAGGGYGWHIFELGLIKIHTMPDQGETLHNKLYKGFIIRFAWWFPVDKV